MSKEKEIEVFTINDDIDERYVAALLIISEAQSLELEDCEVEEAHEMVTKFLEKFEVDVARNPAFVTRDKKVKFH